MSILQQGIVPTSAAGYTIDNSLRLNDNDSAYLSWTPSSAGNRKTYTFSCWAKRANTGTHQRLFSNNRGAGNNDRIEFRFGDDDKLNAEIVIGGTGYTTTTNALFRDTSAWYHIVFAVDTTQATSSNRVKIYTNGTESSYSAQSVPSQNADTEVNNTVQHGIGHSVAYGAYLDGYLAEVNFIDGQALDPSNFGETGDYGEWKPIKYTGTYGTNGFYLDFENSGSLGADVSGNGNNWTPNNLAATDQMLDSPTNNFATLNPLSSTSTHSEGNLKVAPNPRVSSSIAFNSGKYYAEFLCQSLNGGGSTAYMVGFARTKKLNTSVNDSLFYEDGYGYYAAARKYPLDTAIGSWSSYGATYTTGDIIGVALDMDGGNLTFYKNGVSQGALTFTYSDDVVFAMNSGSGDGQHLYVANFGQDSSFAGNKTAQGNSDGNGYGDFYYTPPTGYLALCTQNLPDPTVIPSEHFNTVLYTGDGTTGRAITGVGFQPDLTWLKRRDVAWWHVLQDSVRTAGNVLSSNVTNAEDTAPDGTITSFDSDGFTVDAGGNWTANYNGESVTSWNWKANGSGVSNTNGTITSTVSANQDAGFSIVSYTGNGSDATIGHGLSSTPELLIIKCRSTTGQNWVTWYKDFSATEILRLDSTSAKLTGRNEFNSTLPTSSVFSIEGSNNSVGGSHTYIAYCFHSVDGYSKVGSYTGNGSADGTFVYTGFRPAYILIKATSGTEEWWTWDSIRDSYNVCDEELRPNSSAAAGSEGSDSVDLVSNGFKWRINSGARNGSGVTYIYIAFAENPFKHTNAR